MNLAESIALATWIYTGLTLIYVVFVGRTLWYVRDQLKEQKKARKFQETISMFKEIQARDLDESRRYVEDELPESIERVEYEKLWEHVRRIEPAIINFDRVGYLVHQDHIDRLMIMETYWPAIWRCWKQTKHFIMWLREQRNEKGAYREYEHLFNLSEEYRIQNGLPEPRFYRTTKRILTS